MSEQRTAQAYLTIIDTTDIESIVNYYLATSANSGVDTSTSGWTDTIQSMTSVKQYLWNYEQILGTGGVVINTTTPVIIGRYGQNGQNGVSITSIDEYYKASNSSSQIPSSWNAANVIDKPTATNKYLWNYQVIHYSNGNTEGSASEARIIGIYGDKGDKGDTGISVTKATPIYYLKTSSGSVPTAPSAGTAITSTSTGTGVWTTAIPIYVEGATYYTSIQTYLSSGTSPVSSTAVIDQALTTANSNAYGAYNVATGINQHFWSIESDYATGIPAGSYITDTAINTFKSNKTGGNVLTRSDGIWIRNGVNTLASLTGTALNFYDPSNSNHPLQLSIGANGILQSGNYSRGSDTKFSSNGTQIDLVHGDIITKNFRVSQGLESGLSAGAYIHGTIEATSGYISGDVKIGGSSGTASSTVLTNISTAQSTADNASYAVEIKVTNIDYATPTATLVATAYHLGAVVSSGITYTWYKDAVGTPHNGTASGNTLTVSELNANYICVISSS